MTRGLSERPVQREPSRGPAAPAGPPGCCRVDDLRKEAEAGTIDTVVTAFTDMQGRLFGKRIQVEYFLDEVVEHGIEGCNYLLALDMEMDPVPGYEMANWEGGYGDFAIVPDMATLRRIPWLDRTALVHLRRRQPRRLAGRRLAAPGADRAVRARRARWATRRMMASELEFYLYKESYAEAHEKDYTDLTPTIPYILDYHILATTMDEQYLGPIRRGMHAAGIPVEFSKGEAWYGQHEVNTRYADARHLGRPPHDLQERRQGDRLPATGSRRRSWRSRRRRTSAAPATSTRASSTTTARAPSSTATRRPTSSATTSAGSAPTSGSWRCSSPRRSTPTSATRPRAGRRPRSRGAATTAPAASGSSATGSRGGSSAGSPAPTSTRTSATRRCWPPASTGSRTGPIPGPELKGNAYEEAEAEPFPSTLREAVDLWEGSEFARKAFGEAVCAHYLNYGRTEQRLFDEVVTDYERRRMFERG